MTEITPRKRGDIAVTERISRGYSLIAGSFSHLSIDVGIVESVSKAGVIKRVASLNNGAAKTPRDWSAIYVIDDTDLADRAGFLAECKARLSTNPDTWKPFADLNDLRATARKYRA